MREIKQRDIYLKQLLSFKDQELVKIITGIRRCGKSTVMKLMMRYLIEHDTPSE
ncbi:MAG: AAA family ATPase [Anaerovibrio sp.]|nr:AAA family ATPase [Anaerovibrio sp.]